MLTKEEREARRVRIPVKIGDEVIGTIYEASIGWGGNSSDGRPLYPTTTKDTMSLDLKRQAFVKQSKEEILSCFTPFVYVKEIPNGYCNQWCCRDAPWFIVTTGIGPITVGWRKRVISIDWSASDVKQSAEQLFPEEDVTKSGYLIHAWGVEKAKEYVRRLHSAESPK
jgi:hypothetical protein